MSDELGPLIDALPGLVWCARPDGRVEFLNQRFREYTGQAVVDWKAAIHPADFPDWIERWRSLTHSSQPWELEHRLRRADGTYRWFLCRGSPLADVSGRIVRWCGLHTDINERRRVEDELRATEKTFSRWVESYPGMMTTMRHTGHIAAFSREVLDYFGRTADELRNWAMNDVVHPDDLPRVGAAFAEALKTGKPYGMDHRCRRADGVYRWFQGRGVPVRDEEQNITGWYWSMTDIDDVKRAEETIRASERNLALIIDTIPAAVWSATADGRPEFYNRHYVDFLHRSAEELRNSDWSEVVHPEDLDGLRENWQRILASRQPGQGEVRLRRHDGAYRWFLFRASPLLDDGGNVVRWYGISTEIEDRKQIEAELRRAYKGFADAQELSKTGSFITDLLRDEHNWSDEARRIFEFDPEAKITSQAIRAAVHPDDLALFDSNFARAMSEADVDFVFRIVTARGSVKHVRAVARVVEKVDGRPIFTGALGDVTERIVAEEALNKARSELAHVARITTLSTLTASIAHEVNQPLSGILTNASTCLRLLDADPPNYDAARETVRRTMRDANRASAVIARLRALFSKREFTPEPMDLNEATREVIALSRSELERHRVHLDLELAADLPAVIGDRVQLQQVILNLIRNASDAMAGVDGRQRQLLIRTERDRGNCARLTVCDSGVGVDPESRDKLFSAFYTTKSSGMGIGLSVSSSIIESHRGRIWAAPNDGPGMTFAFTVPCADQQRG